MGISKNSFFCKKVGGVSPKRRNRVYDSNKFYYFATYILLVLEIQRFKSVKACRPKARQAKVNANSSTNSLKYIYFTRYELLKFNNYFVRNAAFRHGV
ncbi:MAG: hypothetical protein LBP59_16290 [Planctomycetaceae bacterium]|nr:hypothetical protein [Planctomycetaceae bacterium]